jgi:hypothetical protein
LTVSGGLPAASSATGSDVVAGLASSFKDKVKIDKKHGSGENHQPPDQKTVMVEVGGKKKRTGGTSSKKSLPTASLVSR